MINGTRRGEGSASRRGRSLPPGKTRYPFYRRLGGPQGRSEQVRKISAPPGFDPRTIQPVASRYTDYATRPTYLQKEAPYFSENCIPFAKLHFDFLYSGGSSLSMHDPATETYPGVALGF